MRETFEEEEQHSSISLNLTISFNSAERLSNNLFNQWDILLPSYTQ